MTELVPAGEAPEVLPDVDALVAAYLRPGMHVHLAGTMSRPNALIYALTRVFGPRRDRFTVSVTAVHSSAHALALGGVVDRMITCFLGDTYPSPRPNPLYRRVAEGQPFTLEAWSLLSYTQRLMAGAMGQPYAVTASLDGSDLVLGKEGKVVSLPDPADPTARVTLVTPLRPDYALVHAVCADRRGNLVMCAPLGEGSWGALAATRGVLASVEQIVADEVVDAQPDRVVIPGHRVAAVCVAPYGAHPQSLRTAGFGGIPGYLDDYAFFREVADACRTPETAARWYREWVVDPGGHQGYLDRLGKRRLADLEMAAVRDQLTTSPASTLSPSTLSASTLSEPALSEPALSESTSCAAASPAVSRAATVPLTDQRRLVVLGARAIVDLVVRRRYNAILAGIGASHVTAWLAAALLRQRGIAISVLAELGFTGMTPVAGDVYLFSQRHAASSTQLNGIPEVLGGLVAGSGGRCLGVLAAGEIDRAGNINTSVLSSGRFLTGSGGANDIASTTDCLVVALASARRYVSTTSFVTSPGHRVRAVVSQFGRFVRDGGPIVEGLGSGTAAGGCAFRLATWLPPGEGDGWPAVPDRAVAELTGWDALTHGCVLEAPVSSLERQLLDELDPEGCYA